MKAAAVLVVAGLALVALAGAGGTASTAAAECTWQRHSKRVVKHVRRHGRVRKVVRRKTWWSCDPSAAPVPAAEAPPPSPTSSPGETPSPEPEPEANRLAVKSQEYYYVLSRAKVKAGELTVELNNQGEDPHNLNIQREGEEGEPLKVAETASLQHSVATFDLQPGTYRLWCSLPEHAEKGMHTTLVVE